MASQIAEGIDGVALPLQGRIETVVGIIIAGINSGHAYQGMVLGSSAAAAPLATGIDTDLADGVDDGATVQQHDRIVTVIPAAACARMVGSAELCAITKTCPWGRLPLRLMLRPGVLLPLK